jgi:hypothetical protein
MHRTSLFSRMNATSGSRLGPALGRRTAFRKSGVMEAGEGGEGGRDAGRPGALRHRLCRLPRAGSREFCALAPAPENFPRAPHRPLLPRPPLPGEVLELLRRMGVEPHCLRLTASGHPEHPLRLPLGCGLVRYLDQVGKVEIPATPPL